MHVVSLGQVLIPRGIVEAGHPKPPHPTWDWRVVTSGRSSMNIPSQSPYFMIGLVWLGFGLAWLV